MFSRSNIASKYKLYTKYVENLQRKDPVKKHIKKLQGLYKQYESSFTKNQHFQKYKQSINNSELPQSIDTIVTCVRNNFCLQKNIYKKFLNPRVFSAEAAISTSKNSSTTSIPSYIEQESISTFEWNQNCSKALSFIQKKVHLQKNIFKKLLNPRTFSAATAAVANQSSPVTSIDPIPEPPPIPSATVDTIPQVSDIVEQINALGEATFASIGLGGNTPVGLVQTCFEYLHVTLGIPWWEAILLGTLFIRICLFPLVIIAQRNAAIMNNYMPQLQILQMKMTDARQMGNQLEVAKYSEEMMLFMKEKKLNPLKNVLVPFAQAPVFISFFMALREMSNVPVDSLRTGGLWWFTDLTVPDQYFLMPLITSLTLFATIELGTDSARLSSQNLQTMKYVLRALPVVILPFTINFPGGILCYWVSSNFISLLQVGFLRIPAVREYFKIERMVTHENLPAKPKGFTEGVKESWTNIKISKELEDRRRVDELQFQKAGRGPLVKTYKYDPTKQTSANAISAKKR